MPTYQNPTDYNRFNQNNPSSNQGYDLAAEKQRIAEGTEEIKKELKEKWNKQNSNAQIFPAEISNMSRDLIWFLLSFQNTLFYNDLAKKFGLSQEQRDILPQIVWHLSQTKNWESLAGLLQRNLPLSPETCNQIGQELTTQILYKAKGLSAGESTSKTSVKAQEKNGPILEQTTINQALQEIPEIGEQLLTTERIRILNFPEEVRPSVKNWLSDYTSYFGYDKVTPIELGNYLFHSENTKKLRPSDRERLTHVLKSFNENASININKTIKQIVFPAADRFANNNASSATNRTVPEPQTPANAVDLKAQAPATSKIPSYNQPDGGARVQSQISNNRTNSNLQTTNRSAIQNPAYRPLGSSLQMMSSQQVVTPADAPVGQTNQSFGERGGFNAANNTPQASRINQSANFNMQDSGTAQRSNPFQPQSVDYEQRTEGAQSEKQGLPNDELSFSSPQRLPYEYEKKSSPTQKPSFSVPQAPANLPVDSYYPLATKPNTVVLEKKPDPPRPAVKNVVDLREQ